MLSDQNVACNVIKYEQCDRLFVKSYYFKSIWNVQVLKCKQYKSINGLVLLPTITSIFQNSLQCMCLRNLSCLSKIYGTI